MCVVHPERHPHFRDFFVETFFLLRRSVSNSLAEQDLDDLVEDQRRGSLILSFSEKFTSQFVLTAFQLNTWHILKRDKRNKWLIGQ